jgi:hypothetical protein
MLNKWWRIFYLDVVTNITTLFMTDHKMSITNIVGRLIFVCFIIILSYGLFYNYHKLVIITESITSPLHFVNYSSHHCIIPKEEELDSNFESAYPQDNMEAEFEPKLNLLICRM